MTQIAVMRCLTAIKRCEAAEMEATVLLEENLPIGTRVRVHVSCNFEAKILNPMTPVCESVRVGVESLEALDILWRPTADKSGGALIVPIASLEIVS